MRVTVCASRAERGRAENAEFNVSLTHRKHELQANSPEPLSDESSTCDPHDMRQ